LARDGSMVAVASGGEEEEGEEKLITAMVAIYRSD
jgi:hypothetical protein